MPGIEYFLNEPVFEYFKNDLKDKLNQKADVIISTASGSIAHFEDGAEADAVSVIAHFEPVQDLHGYDSPWPAGGGKNLLDINNIVVENTSNWSVEVNGDTLTVTHKTADTSGTPTFVLNQPSGTYVISIGSVNITGQVSLYINGAWVKTINNGSTFTIDAADTNEIKFSAQENQATIISKIQIESGSTATAYAPYENVCPISGRTEVVTQKTGKNLFNPDSAGKEWVSVNNVVTTIRSVKSIRIPVKAGDTLTLSNETLASSTQIMLIAFLKNNNVLSRNVGRGENPFVTATAPSDADCAIASFYTWAEAVNAQLELGSTATAYEPYNGETYPITFPSEAGTVYGGYVDVVKGKLVVKMDVTDLSSLTWVWDSTYEFWRTDMLNSVIKKSSTTSTVTDSICEEYKAFAYNGFQLNKSLIGFAIATTGRVVVRNGSDTVKPTNDMCYYLALPIEYDITPQQITTLLGVNNIWADTGDAEVKYRADTKLYIEQLTKPTEDDMTANANIASGKFFMVGNRLFLSTSAIASGETINLGTNCTELSLADALNNLN